MIRISAKGLALLPTPVDDWDLFALLRVVEQAPEARPGTYRTGTVPTSGYPGATGDRQLVLSTPD